MKYCDTILAISSKTKGILYLLHVYLNWLEISWLYLLKYIINMPAN